MTNFVSLVLLVFIVTIAFLAAAPVASASVAQSKDPDAFLLTLQAECGAYVAPLECLPFLTAFKWPLSVPHPPQPLGLAHWDGVSPPTFLLAVFPCGGSGCSLDATGGGVAIERDQLRALQCQIHHQLDWYFTFTCLVDHKATRTITKNTNHFITICS